MAFILFLLANALLFIRPAELFPDLGNVQIYLLCIVGAIACAIPRLHNQMRLVTLVQQPINLCVIGVTVAVVLSHLSSGDAASATKGLNLMGRVLVYYLLLVALVTTPQKLKALLVTTAVCATLMTSVSIVDFYEFVAEWSGRSDLAEVKTRETHLPEGAPKLLRHCVERYGENLEGEDQWAFRMSGLGIFHDPNDLALLIVMSIVISVYFLSNRAAGAVRFVWIVPIGIMSWALLLTQSRGGILCAGVALMAWLATRYGGKVAIAIGAMCAMALPVALGRAGSISLGSGTGQQRIQLWSDGLAQLKSFKFFFGIGEGMYPEVAGLVAHNSYVHAFVELGFFGGTLFFGCFFLPALALFRMQRSGFRIQHPDLKRMQPYIAAILGGWCMGMSALSRCYVPPTYMVCGVAAAWLNLVGFHRPLPRPVLTFNRTTAQWLVSASVCLLIGCFLVVKLFARWS